jgi:hypothetical protein
MPGAGQYTPTSSSSPPTAHVGITHRHATYTYKPDKGGNMKEKGSLALTEFVRMFRADRKDDSVRKRSRLIHFCPTNNMRDARPALMFTR